MNKELIHFLVVENLISFQDIEKIELTDSMFVPFKNWQYETLRFCYDSNMIYYQSEHELNEININYIINFFSFDEDMVFIEEKYYDFFEMFYLSKFNKKCVILSTDIKIINSDFIIQIIRDYKLKQLTNE